MKRFRPEYTIDFRGNQYHLMKRCKFLWWYFYAPIYSSGILENVEEEYKKVITVYDALSGGTCCLGLFCGGSLNVTWGRVSGHEHPTPAS